MLYLRLYLIYKLVFEESVFSLIIDQSTFSMHGQVSKHQ